jgi:small GTP-binding protein
MGSEHAQSSLLKGSSALKKELRFWSPMKAGSRLPPLKVVIVGEAGVGKTNLLKHLLQQPFSAAERATESYDRHSSFVQLGQEIIRLEIFDTAGQEKYRSLAPIFYRGARLALIVYDVTNRQSFSEVQWWHDEYLRQAQLDEDDGPGAILLVGEKNDLEHLREVRREEGVALALDWMGRMPTGMKGLWNLRTATEHSSLASTGEMSDVLRLMMVMVGSIDRHLREKYGTAILPKPTRTTSAGAVRKTRPTLIEALASLEESKERRPRPSTSQQSARREKEAQRLTVLPSEGQTSEDEEGDTVLERELSDCAC